MAQIEVKGLTKRYGSVKALNDLSFSVSDKRAVGFLGPNGAGKTTTLRILTGLANATSGEAHVCGIDVRRNPHEVRRHIGYLSQSPVFYNWMSAVEFMHYVGSIFGVPRAEVAKRSEELLKRLDIWEARNRRIGGYSGGMKQRLGIAQALLNKPEIVLLDEPVSALDPIGRHEILKLIAELSHETSIFMSSHVLGDVERVCDYVIIVNRGQVAAQASIKELKEKYTTPTFVVETDQQADIGGLMGSEPWFANAREEGPNWRIAVDDVQAAKVRIPTLLLNQGHTFRRFEQLAPNLEDIFLKVVADNERAAD